MPDLAQRARRALEAAGVANATVVIGDGTLGWRALAPFDAILVSAASPAVPKPLLEQLAEGGRLVIPLGDAQLQTLTRVEKRAGEIRISEATGVRFVPLVGEFGFKPPNEEPHR